MHELFTEKYRPRKVEDCILPSHLVKPFTGYVEHGLTQHLLLVGEPGTGKTTVARAICEELGLEYLVINCSAETGVDTVRNKIVDFASTVSVEDKKKAIILDESDYLSMNAQAALRNYLETFSEVCKFIFTANFKNKLMPALHSRCAVFEFNYGKEEAQDLKAKFFKRMRNILTTENIEFNPDVLAKLVTKFFPDFRRTLNELQRHSKGGELTIDSLLINNDSFKALMGALKKKDFKLTRQWIAENTDNSDAVFRKIYDTMDVYLKPQSIPEVVVLLGEYQHKAAFVADPQINLAALMVELMVTAEYQ